MRIPEAIKSSRYAAACLMLMTVVAGSGALSRADDVTLVAQAPNTPRPRRAGPQSGRPPLPARGVLTHIPSSAGGDQGIAVRIVAPREPRYPDGVPVAIAVAGGHSAGNASSRMNVAGHGFIDISFAFPGGGRAEAASGGTYDYRGPKSIEALRDVILFALGKTTDTQGRKLAQLTKGMRALPSNVGLHGGSHGGNACGAAMGLWGHLFPELAWYVSMESPYGDGAVDVILGSRRDRLNPAYDPNTGILNLSHLAYDPDLQVRPFGAGRGRGPSTPAPYGSLYFDMNSNGQVDGDEDFKLQPLLFDLGEGPRTWYALQLTREAHRRNLFGAPRPPHIPTLEESIEFWRYRDATGLIGDAVRKLPKVAVIVIANETDHVQIAPDHPHISAQVNAFQRAGAKFIRLNPDRSYTEWIVGREAPAVPDNDAGLAYHASTIAAALCPDGAVPRQLLSPAAMCELADRVQAGNFEANLGQILFPNTPKATRPTPGAPRIRPPAVPASRL